MTEPYPILMRHGIRVGLCVCVRHQFWLMFGCRIMRCLPTGKVTDVEAR